MDPSVAVVVGLAMNVVGIFFLANSIIFRKPKQVLEEFFGVDRGSLHLIKDYVLNKIQVVIGFLFLTGGFVLQAVGAWQKIHDQATVLLICGGIFVTAVLVYIVGAHYSRRSFRKYLRSFFRTHEFSFTANMALTKEIGQIFGIPHQPDETVEAYVQKVRRYLQLPQEQGGSNKPEKRREAAVAAALGRGGQAR